MPRRPSSLTNCSIYVLESNDLRDKYVGSTNDINRRMIHHKYRCTFEKGSNYNLKLYSNIRRAGGFNTFKCRILETQTFNTLGDKLRRETYWINLINPNLNIIRCYN